MKTYPDRSACCVCSRCGRESPRHEARGGMTDLLARGLARGHGWTVANPLADGTVKAMCPDCKQIGQQRALDFGKVA